MPKAKPVSLSPLKFDKAIEALIRVAPSRVKSSPQRAKPTCQRKRKSKLKESNKPHSFKTFYNGIFFRWHSSMPNIVSKKHILWRLPIPIIQRY